MKLLRSLKTSVTIYQSVRSNIPEHLDIQQHRCDNPKIRNFTLYLTLYFCFVPLTVHITTLVAQFIRIQSLIVVQSVNNEQKGHARQHSWRNKRYDFGIILDILQEIVLMSIKTVSLSTAGVSAVDSARWDDIPLSQTNETTSGFTGIRISRPNVFYSSMSVSLHVFIYLHSFHSCGACPRAHTYTYTHTHTCKGWL